MTTTKIASRQDIMSHLTSSALVEHTHSHTHPLFKSQRSCPRALYLLSRMALLIDEIPTQLQGHNIGSPSWLGEKLAPFYFPCFFFSRRVIYDSTGECISPTHWNGPHLKGPSPHKGQTQMGQTGEAGTTGDLAHVFELTWYPRIDTQRKYSWSHPGPTTALISSQLRCVRLWDWESNDARCTREDILEAWCWAMFLQSAEGRHPDMKRL